MIKINEEIRSYIGLKFEDIIKEFFVLYNGKNIKNIKLDFDEIGPWWGKNLQGNSEEIDIILKNTKEKQIIACEVKWKNELTGIDIIKNLEKKSTNIPFSGMIKYILISKSGFTKEAIKYMSSKNMLYLDLNDLSFYFDKYANSIKLT
ncbi:MAG: DUF234 domain-containing protein [Nanobdellota archaeon]